MTDSDGGLQTDDDDSPPPQGRTRNSMDETEEQLAQLQLENVELQHLLLHERKSSILNIHKMNVLENELTAYKNRLEAEKYESEANKVLIHQLEQHLDTIPIIPNQIITDIQNEPETITSTHNIQNPASPSPRPPPSDPPPPVPPSKPSNKEINTTSNDILLNLENLDKKHTSSARRSLRRRRASLPSINILPSFKSLKSAMGFFGVDEDNELKENPKKENNNEDNNNNNNNNSKKKKEKIIKKDNDKHEKDKHEKDKANDKNKTLNKKLNPKEIKQLYIKNLKLQAQIDKYREREKEFEYKLQENIELVTELRNQVNAKSEVVKKLDEQLNKKNNQNISINQEIQKLERLLVEKDTTIQGLKQDMLKIEKNINMNMNMNLSPEKYEKSGNLSPSPDPLPVDKYGNNNHNRSLTPGGYQIDGIPWDVTETDVKNNDSSVNPSAPPQEYEFLDDKIHGLSLNQKLSQRPEWKELNERGILLDDPTKSSSLQAAHRTLHKRKASQKLDKFLVNRPNKKHLQNTNILKNVELDDDMNNKIPKGIKVDNGLDLNSKIKQRPQWKELNDRGILLDDPTTKKSHSLQAAQRQLHKRKASQNLDKLLMKRPTPNELHEQNIIDANTAALFFGASPTTQVVTPRTDYMDNDQYSQMMDATDKLFAASQPINNSSEYKSNPNDDIIYKDNLPKPEISKRLERNLKQRPSVDETMARGILMYRTDTKLNYDLQERHKQLHKRKASQSLEKLMSNRPKSNQLEKKGILIKNQTDKRKHKRKTSQDLEAGLKKRKSISELQGLGLLFSNKGYEYQDDGGNVNVFMEEDEQHKNIASLFKQKPRTSKPLHETDFKGIDDFDAQNDANKENKRRGSVDNSFEPFKLSKQDRISRIGSKLSQRPSVEDMRMRGLLYEHPSISKSLVERKRDLMKRRASNKVESLLQSRPNRNELENKNILLREDETLEKRKRHKRKRSQNLENAIMRRPKLMEEQEAQRQRRRSMNDSDFTPDYLQHIMNDDEEEEYKQDLQQIEIRFLNIGGFVIPLVSPKFMGDLAGGGPPINSIAGDIMDDFTNMHNNMEMEMEIEKLREELDDLKMEMTQKDAKLKQQDVKITSLKGENTTLKQKFSRKSLVDFNHLNTLNINDKTGADSKNREKEIEKLQREIELNNNYISKLSYFMKEEKGINIPTFRELKKNKNIRAKLKNKLIKRPSFMDLQEKHILSSNFINDVTNQNAQIAERKLQFRRTSDLISDFLTCRPSKESLEQYFKDSLDYNEYMKQQKENDGNIKFIASDIDIVDNATKDELREEVVRLNNKLATKISINNKLEKENETMRFQLREKFNEKAEILSRNLKAHSINENTVIEEAIIEADLENRKIKELKGENDQLKQKIRRLSTVDSATFANVTSINSNTEMKQFVNWSRQLSWPNIVSSIYLSSELTDFLLMKKVINELRNINQNCANEIFSLNTQINNINNISSNNTNKINKLEEILEKQQIEHLKDKEKLIENTMKEMDRLRAQIKHIGKVQQIKYKKEKQNDSNSNQNQNNNYSYVSSATQYFWNKK